MAGGWDSKLADRSHSLPSDRNEEQQHPALRIARKFKWLHHALPSPTEIESLAENYTCHVTTNVFPKSASKGSSPLN